MTAAFNGFSMTAAFGVSSLTTPKKGEEIMEEKRADRSLQGKVALVAGATRGAGRAISVELCGAGAFVYATGRSSRVSGPSDMDRPETIEETGEQMLATGGEGSALRVDHLDVDAVEDLVARIEAERGRLDILVNDIFGGTNTRSGTRSSGSMT